MWNVVSKTEKEKEEERMKKEGEWHKDKGVHTLGGSYGAAVRVCEWLGWGSNRATAGIEWGVGEGHVDKPSQWPTNVLQTAEHKCWLECVNYHSKDIR